VEEREGAPPAGAAPLEAGPAPHAQEAQGAEDTQAAQSPPDVSGLIACYLEAGRVEVSLPPAQALAIFARVLGELAPLDRLEASFSTTPAAGYALSVSPQAPPLAKIAGSVAGLARLSLWRLARGRLPEAARAGASLRGAQLPWLAQALIPEDLAGSYSALVRSVRVEPAEAREAALIHLRRALEGALSGLAAPEAADVLVRLVAAGLVSEELGVPPLWLPRVVLRTGCLGELPEPLLPRVLDAPALPMILESVQRSPLHHGLPFLSRLARLARVPPSRPSALGAACTAPMRQILEQGVSDANLAPALALLLLESYARAGDA